MSELKARMLGETMNEYGCDTKIYLKFEADKVIAEKDTKIIQLEALIENYNRISREIIDNANHQKYKRCLAMAKWCKIQDDNFFKIHGVGHLQMKHAEYKRTFFRKWHKRWLELAKKFKEA